MNVLEQFHDIGELIIDHEKLWTNEKILPIFPSCRICTGSGEEFWSEWRNELAAIGRLMIEVS